MPTANRIEFMFRAIQYFLQQDYPYKELVIIDDSNKSAARFIPNLYSIRYFYMQNTASIGMKRNKACEKAAGNIIVHMDDDDWYAPDWVSYQVNALLRSDADICGLNKIRYYSILTESKYQMTERYANSKKWLSGATLAYYKAFWKKHKFKDLQIGEDGDFVRNTGAKIFAHNYYKGFLATIHSSNVRIKEF
jgi:glycosyltransferase involved in cell wall biosynthesis